MMESIRIAILDIGNQAVAYMDNSAPKSLHYYDDELHTYLQGSAYTFKFTVSAFHEDSEYLVVGNHLAFRYKDKGYYLNIMHVEEDEFTVEVESYGLIFELLGEDKDSYKASKAMSFVEYMKVFDSPGAVKIGINEISSYTRTLEWTAGETMLARIYSLATNFDAEVEFVTELNNDYSLKQITMNVYREHSDTVQGIGTDRRDEYIRYGKGITGIRKTSDITELYTAIRPYGKDNLTISGLDKKEYDADGNLEYQVSGNNILAVQAKDRFPAMLTDYTKDRYVAKIWSYETDNKNTLYSKALSKLKEICVPKASYEVEGYIEKDIGDTVTIIDEEYHPELYLSARITEQIRSFTDPTRNKTTFDNFQELQSQLDPELLAKMNALIEQNKTYTCMISTDNGTTFKNNTGSTTLTASVRDGVTDITDKFTIVWSKDSVELATGKSITVNAADVDGKSLYRFDAKDSDGNVKGFCEVTVTDVSDGTDGVSPTVEVNEDTSLTITDSEGTKNTVPLKGADGISSYTHIKYSDDGETFTGIGNLASQNRDDWVAGYYSSATTVNTEEPDKSTTSYTRICMKTAFKVIPGKTYKLNTGYTASDTAVRMGYTAYLADGSCKRAVLPNYNNASYTIPDDVTHVRIYMYSASATSLDTWTEWFESGAVAPIFGEPNELLGSYPGAWMGTLVDSNEVASLTFSDYNWSKINGQPTGIVESDTEPDDKYDGMLWKNTGTTAGLVQGATYRWNGTSWDMYTFRAENIEAESFKGYEFNGSIFCSEFTETISDFSRYVGKMRIENGKIQITCTSQTRASVNDSWIPGPERVLTLNYEGLGFSENGVSEILDLSNLQALFSLLSGHKFSLDSNATGETWINGKPIYSKVINYGAIAPTGENTTISKEHGISNVENIWIDLSNSFLVASGKYYPVIRQQAMGKTSSVSWSSSVHVRPSVGASKIYLDIGSNANFDDSYITVRYTKTTD